MESTRKGDGLMATLPNAWKPFETKEWILAYDAYMGAQGYMTSFHGTWRQLLEHVLGYEEGSWDEDGWEVNGRHVHSIKEMTDEELLQWFKDANGDGQQYCQVWDVKEGKQVLG